MILITMAKQQPSTTDILAAIQAGFADVDTKLNDLTTATDALAQKLDSYLTKEWTVHRHHEHPRLVARIRSIERKLGIKAS